MTFDASTMNLGAAIGGLFALLAALVNAYISKMVRDDFSKNRNQMDKMVGEYRSQWELTAKQTDATQQRLLGIIEGYSGMNRQS
ncbi:hypothetical protein WEI85_00640 [Actinomycetes bacterium KLBMP 9797]